MERHAARRANGALLALAICSAVADAASACEVAAAREFRLETRKPVLGPEVRLSFGFGMQKHPILMVAKLHTGVDWAAPHGAPVIAAGRGRVISAEPDGEYGNKVVVGHGGDWQTVYAQLAGFSVRPDDCVSAGTIIGTVGITGLTAGPHLHFEVRHNDVPINPIVLPTSDKSQPR